MKKEIAIGFLTALVATSFGCFIFIEFFSQFDFDRSLELIIEGNLEAKVLILGAVANLFVFFIFLKKKQIYRARGVLMATFVIAFLVLIFTFLSFK